jgi:ABC-type multidrug transport system permease subunit
MPNLIYSLRVIWACMHKEIQTALAELGSTLMGVLRPVLILILMSLLAVGGGEAPTAVVMEDTGPYAQQFYNAMAHASSFRLQRASAQEARDLLEAGRIVAVVTIPADFDARLRQNQSVQVPVQINNLNTDFTNDIRRAVPLSITLFYGKAYPDVVTVTPHEHDLYAQDTGYIPYLTVSVLVLGLMFAALMQAGDPAAREWEDATIKELLLSPASRLAIVVGKMLGALVVGLASGAVVLTILILVIGVWPVHWGEVIGFTLLTLLIFVACGTLLGTLIKRRLAYQLLAVGSMLPLLMVSGPFGPISFDPPIAQGIAQLFPVYYAIVLMQHAFHGFELNTYGVGLNVAIRGGYMVLMMVLAALVLRRSTTV